MVISPFSVVTLRSFICGFSEIETEIFYQIWVNRPSCTFVCYLSPIVPPTICKQIVFLLMFSYSFPFISPEIIAQYSPSSSLHTFCMTSFVLLLPLYFLVLMSIHSIARPLRFRHLIDCEESTFSISASKHAVSPQITSSSPLITISCSSD